MRILWLTLADPDPPTNGQFLYSYGLIHALAGGGARLDVVGLARGTRRQSHGFPDGQCIRWWLAPDESVHNWRQHLSLQAAIAWRSTTPLLKLVLRARLRRRDLWDAIVIDSICAGWALDILQAMLPKSLRPPIVYIAHNHEASVAAALARAERNPIKRAVRYLDAGKVALLESRLAHSAALVTSNTPDDCEKFSRQYPGKPIQHLPPGYNGRMVLARRITPDTPRTAVIIGSFDWPPKRQSLESFLAVAAPRLAAAGIALKIVGAAQPDYLNFLRANFPTVTFTGHVPDVAPYMADARAALVPDLLGGFKLKSLDYVFNRLPIMGIQGSVPGLPLEPDRTILLYPDHEALADAVCQVIDDVDRLDRIQNGAYEACRLGFCWRTIGLALLGAINGICESEAAKTAGRSFMTIAKLTGDSGVPG